MTIKRGNKRKRNAIILSGGLSANVRSNMPLPSEKTDELRYSVTERLFLSARSDGVHCSSLLCDMNILKSDFISESRETAAVCARADIPKKRFAAEYETLLRTLEKYRLNIPVFFLKTEENLST